MTGWMMVAVPSTARASLQLSSACDSGSCHWQSCAGLVGMQARMDAVRHMRQALGEIQGARAA